MKYYIISIITLIFINCSGNKPQPDWTAKDYFNAAKEKYDDEDYFEAVNDFTVVLLRFAGSSVADSAQYYLADSHFMMGDYLVAGVEFEKLINDMNQSPMVNDAQLRLAESYYELSPRPSLDQEYTLRAIREYQYFVEEFPTDTLKESAEKRITELREKLAEKEVDNAEIYRKMKEFKAAVIYFDQVLAKFYDTTWADDAQYGKIRSLLESEEYEQAQLEVAKFEQQFPESELMENVLKLKNEIVQLQAELAQE